MQSTHPSVYVSYLSLRRYPPIFKSINRRTSQTQHIESRHAQLLTPRDVTSPHAPYPFPSLLPSISTLLDLSPLTFSHSLDLAQAMTLVLCASVGLALTLPSVGSSAWAHAQGKTALMHRNHLSWKSRAVVRLSESQSPALSAPSVAEMLETTFVHV